MGNPSEVTTLDRIDDRYERLSAALRRVVRGWRRRRAKARGGRVRTLLLALTLGGLIAAFVWSIGELAPDPRGARLRVDQLSALADDKRVVEATFLDEDAVVTGRYACDVPARKGPAPASAARAPLCARGTPKGTTQTYWMPYPKSDLATGALLKALVEANARVEIAPQTEKAQVRLVATFLLPLVILANLFALLFTAGRGGSQGIGEVIMFGSLGRRRVRRRRARPVSFSDVAGAEEAVGELKEVVEYLRSPTRYRRMGAMPPKGILMIGPPGCGKTLLAKAAAGEAKVPFFSVAGAEFVESLVGVGAARVRDLFRRVRAAAPAIVFIDELDAAGRRRSTGGGAGGTDEREQTLNQMLVEMDGFEPSAGIVVIGATNRPDILDPALLRPGRFDRHITVDQPDRGGREGILALHARGRRLAPSVDLGAIARRTPGFSGADLANVINEAALLAVRSSKQAVEMAELLEAVERVLAGPQRRGRVLSAGERHRAAVHEAGHAVVAAALGDAEHVHRVSILARARTLGGAAVVRGGEDALPTEQSLQRRLAVAMAGPAAESLVLGEVSAGIESDLESATVTARDVVERYGMSERIGRTRLFAHDAGDFVGDGADVTLSDALRREVEAEIRRLLDEAEAAAARALTANRELFDAFVQRLETQETIEGTDLADALADVRPPGWRAAGSNGPRRPKRAPARRR